MYRTDVEGGCPVWIEEIAKADTPWRDVDEIAAVLGKHLLRHGGAAFIGVFDLYGLNLRLGEALPAAMQDAKAFLFCPGANLLNPALIARCPCVIGVADMGNRFVISFLDASLVATSFFSPAGPLTQWVDNLRS